MNPTDKSKLYAGIIWILSGLALLIYGILLYFNTSLPGMAELVHFLNTIDKRYIYVGAFASIFIEGLYFIGSFFPGASLVVVLAIVSQVGGFGVFATTILLIFIGWSLAGVVNIYVAQIYRKKILKLTHDDGYHIKDRVWTTWFPAFRASYEVAQVAEGGKPLKVFMSSLRVRFWASVFVGCLALIIPLFFDISKSTDREGYASILVVIIISVVVGVVKIRGYYSAK